MSNEVKQPGNVPLVTPLTPARNTGRRNTPAKRPPKPSSDKRRSPADDQSHRVDEYV